MDRDGVKHATLDSSLEQGFTQFIAPSGSHRKLVEDRRHSRDRLRQAYRSRVKSLQVTTGELSPLFVRRIELRQFCAQDRRLNFIEAAVAAMRFSDVTGTPAVLPKRPDFL